MSKEIDKLLLQTYDKGWNDSADNNDTGDVFKDNSLLRKAYYNGWSDFICGDDVSSVDLQTKEEILKKIKQDD